MSEAALPWQRAEPGKATALWQARRLFRRSLKRPILLGALVLLATTIAAGFVGTRPYLHRAKVALRVIQNRDSMLTHTGLSNRDIRHQVTEIAFSQSNLMRFIVAQLGPSRRPEERDLQDAVDDLRDHLEVEILRNPLMTRPGLSDPTQSFYVVIELAGRTPAKAGKGAKGLADLVVSSTGGIRKEADRAAERLSVVALEEAEQGLRSMEKETTDKVPERLSLAELQEHRASVRQRVGQARQRLDRLEQKKESADVQLRTESALPGIEFQALEPVVDSPYLSRLGRVVVAALLAFLLTLPTIALLMGAFDPAIYFSDDLRHLGIRPLGEVKIRSPSGMPRTEAKPPRLATRVGTGV